jgi:Cd2+/Zn2+-exporting ATPase
MEKNKEYILDGLCCANCASKIEKEVGRLEDVKEANINLIDNRLKVSMNRDGSNDITGSIVRIVASHEPSVKVIDLSKEDVNNSAEHTRGENGAREQEESLKVRLYLFRLMVAVAIGIIFSMTAVPVQMKTAAFLLAYAMSGYEVLVTAGKNILKGKVFDENFLMGIASLGAFLMGEQVEAIAVLIFYGIGELLQNMAVSKSKKNIAGLMDIRPDYANRLIDGTVTTVAPEQVEVGDTIIVRPGEKIPLDGMIRKGSSYIDTRALTGESIPREAAEGDTVLSGTLNTSGVLEIEVTKPFGEATVSKILELVQNAGSKKAESEKFITKFARYYTPFVVFSAAAVALFPPLLGFGPFTQWLYRALSFLIISCPCALVISIPLSFFGGIGGAAKQGILIKGGNYLDALNQVDTIVMDKTGTITKGVFEVSKIVPTPESEEDELLRFAAIAESQSTHPIARSIISYYMKRSNTMSGAAKITEKAGYGVIAEFENDLIYAGNEKLMNSIQIPVISPEASGSVVYIAVNKKYLGFILISDEIKPGVKEAITQMKQIGVHKTVMLTGDHKNAAMEIAKLSMVDEYEAELLPQDKVAWFENYKQKVPEKGKIVFVGDGINDAPVLAGADIGIAMGGIGSDAAIEAADVVIMNDEIGKIVTAVKIARKTKKIVFQNIIFALGIKILIMVLAFLGITSIWFAIFADVGVALLALLNAMRAMRVK